MNTEQNFRCGYIAIVGRPNVGKSTLLNHLIGQKLSITSRKPQTTRHQILGIHTENDFQAIYVDTPGIHKRAHHALNRYMNKVAASVVYDVDVVVFVVDGMHWLPDDEWVLKKLSNVETPVVLVVNKIDKVSDKKQLLPYLEKLTEKRHFSAIVPMSAVRTEDCLKLEKMLVDYLPKQAAMFPEDQITDRSERFLASEIIREKLTRQLGQELPYAITVEIEQFKLEGKLIRISAVIYVEKASQKPMIIGEDGQRLKKVGQESRLDMETLFDHKIFLQLWVKVKRGWSDNERGLQQLGYTD